MHNFIETDHQAGDVIVLFKECKFINSWYMAFEDYIWFCIEFNGEMVINQINIFGKMLSDGRVSIKDDHLDFFNFMLDYCNGEKK